MSGTTWVLVIIWAICAIAGVWHKRQKEAREDKLLHENPQAWQALKDQQDKQAERKRERLGKAAGAGVRIARWFLKK